MKRWQTILTGLIFLLLFFVAASPGDASEGVVELRSTVGQETRCFVLSAFLTDNHYHLLITCRELIYPSDPTSLHYVLWASPASGDSPIRLGTLGFGKLATKTKIKFTNLFVTKETSTKPRDPAGQEVLRGNVRSIGFLEGPAPPPTPTAVEEGGFGGIIEEPKGEESPTPTTSPTTTRIQKVLRTLFILPVLGLVALVIFVLILVRKRG
jgi:hypothetical protein